MYDSCFGRWSQISVGDIVYHLDDNIHFYDIVLMWQTFLVGFFLIQSAHTPEPARSSRWHIKESQQNFQSHNICFEKKMLVSKNID